MNENDILVQYQQKVKEAINQLTEIDRDIDLQIKRNNKGADFYIDLILKLARFNHQDIKSNSRRRELAYTKYVITFYLKENTSMTWKEIGECIDGADHSTSIHRYNKYIDDAYTILNAKRESLYKPEKFLKTLIENVNKELNHYER